MSLKSYPVGLAQECAYQVLHTKTNERWLLMLNITKLTKKLRVADYISAHHKAENKKIVTCRLPKKVKKMLSKVEPELNKSMRLLLKGVSTRDVLGYVRVLNALQSTAAI